ncbi:unnamed protein product [Amoebophrya sp. A120]|nr:unnamed protein product [Amoebophrya sp. A120]|eukprot:GSA120T00010681001.1
MNMNTVSGSWTRKSSVRQPRRLAALGSCTSFVSTLLDHSHDVHALKITKEPVKAHPANKKGARNKKAVQLKKSSQQTSHAPAPASGSLLERKRERLEQPQVAGTGFNPAWAGGATTGPNNNLNVLSSPGVVSAGAVAQPAAGITMTVPFVPVGTGAGGTPVWSQPATAASAGVVPGVAGVFGRAGQPGRPLAGNALNNNAGNTQMPGLSAAGVGTSNTQAAVPMLGAPTTAAATPNGDSSCGGGGDSSPGAATMPGSNMLGSSGGINGQPGAAGLITLGAPGQQSLPSGPGALDAAAAAARKADVDAKLAQLLATRQQEDAESLALIQALPIGDVDLAIAKRGGLAGQTAFSPIPPNCGGDDCLMPGMSGNDNGQGLRAFGAASLNGPAAAHMSMSWDLELMYFHANMLGGLFTGGKYNAVLGPGAQVWRNPGCGRSGEYIPGEDPVFGVFAVEAWTLGYNRQTVSPVWKHYISNDMEADRMNRNGKLTIPWEAEMDIYLKPFVAGSNIGASATMCGYHWLVDPEGGEPVSMCYNKRNKWLYEESKRTWIVTDYPAAEMFETYTKKPSASDSGHSWANWGSWKQPLNYEKRTAQEQMVNSEPIAEEDNGHQVMDNQLQAADRALKDRYLAGWVGWARELGIFRKGPRYTDSNYPAVWQDYDDNTKNTHYRWTSRTIAESMVLLKNDGNLLPLKDGDQVDLDSSCTGDGNARTLTSEGSGEMNIHLKETRAETAFRGKTGGGGKVKLVCSLVKAGEGRDRDTIEQPRPPAGGDNVCVFAAGAGSVAMPWANDFKCIIFSIAPSVHAFTGLMYFMYGQVNPGAHTIMSVVANGGDLPWGKAGVDADGDSKHEVGYMILQARGTQPVFEFGWGLPFGAAQWEDVVDLVPTQHDRTLRRIAFCVTSKLATDPPGYPAPSPTAQFYAQLDGRPYKQLLAFGKVRNLAAGAQECRAVYYDPVAEWEGGNDDGLYQPKPFQLFYSLNGYSKSLPWPVDREQGADAVTSGFKRGATADANAPGYPDYVLQRHIRMQTEVGSTEREAKIFPNPASNMNTVLDFFRNANLPDCPVETETIEVR